MNKIIKKILFKILPDEYKAVMLFGFIFFREKNPSEDLVRHEEIHLMQYKKDGAIKFYSSYIYQYIKNLIRYKNHNDAYRNISYEVEAYDK
jgi:hypothetical protein